MIWFIIFVLFFFFSIKEITFFNTFFHLESFTVFMLSVVFICGTLIFKFLFNCFNEKESQSYFYMFFLVLMWVGMTFITNSSFFFLLFLEFCALPMSWLIMNFSKDFDKFLSVLFMFSFNIVGSILFITFSNYFFSTFSSDSTYNCNFSSSLFCSSMLLSCLILILISKLPLLFFHFWLTKAHVSASGSCSMILAGLMLKLGSFGLVKFFMIFMYSSMLLLCSFFSISLFGCLFFSLLMLRFTDLKYLVACSSILHMSLIFPFSCMGSTEGLLACMFMMTGHGLVSYFLFFMISLVYEFSYSRGIDFNKSLESICKYTSMYLFFFIFLNIGFPLFINFYSEFMFVASLNLFSIFSVLVFCLAMFFSIFFSMFTVSKLIFGKKLSFSSSHSESSLNFSSLMIISSLIFLPFLS